MDLIITMLMSIGVFIIFVGSFYIKRIFADRKQQRELDEYIKNYCGGKNCSK